MVYRHAGGGLASLLVLCRDLDRLNDLVGELEAAERPGYALLLEHLESARFYLSGAMPVEYRLSLEMAQKELGSVPDESVRSRLQEFVERQLTSARHAAG